MIVLHVTYLTLLQVSDVNQRVNRCSIDTWHRGTILKTELVGDDLTKLLGCDD